MRNIKISLLTAALLTLPACGGGGSDETSSTTAEKIASAKSMVSETRTIANISGLEAPAQIAGNNIEFAVAETQQAQQCMGNSLGIVTDALVSCYTGYVNADPNGVPHYNGPASCSIQTTDSNAAPKTATMTFTANSPSGHDTATLTGNIVDTAVNLTKIVIPRETSGNNNSISTLTSSIAGTVTTTGSACGTKSLRATFGDAASAVALTAKKITGPSGVLEDDIDSASMDGPVKLEEVGASNNAVIAGEVQVGVLRCTSAGNCPSAGGVVYNLASFALDGSVTDGSNNQTSISLVASQTTGRSFNPYNPYSSSNFADVTIDLDTDLQLTGQPIYQVLLHVAATGGIAATQNNGAGPAAITTNLKLSRGAQTLTIAAQKAGTNDVTQVTVSNEQGVSMIVLASNGQPGVVGSITVEGEQVATITNNGGGVYAIHYVDGTIDTLN